MSRKFQDFMREVETEARREGPKAVAELAGFDAHFRLAGQLLALRKARGLTQRQLSAKAGVQQSEISRMEAAHANPTMTTVSALARVLGAEVRLMPSRTRSVEAKAGRRRVATASARLVRRAR